MANGITIEILGRIGEAQIGEAIRTITLGYAQQTQYLLNNDLPAPPARGSMQFKSDRQRKFVMAGIRDGRIQVPYKRGTGGGMSGSKALNRSYRIDLNGDEAILTSAAYYAPYVVGDQQAQIHQGRWMTATKAVDEIQSSGTLDKIVQQVLEAL